MRARKDMLRAFIAEFFAEQPLANVAASLVELMPEATSADRLRAAQVPLLLADLVDVTEQVVLKADDDDHVRGFAGGLLTYVYNPLDLLQADGVVGWLDDALVCATGLRRLHDEGHVQLDEAALALCDVATETGARRSARRCTRRVRRAAVEDQRRRAHGGRSTAVFCSGLTGACGAGPASVVSRPPAPLMPRSRLRPRANPRPADRGSNIPQR